MNLPELLIMNYSLHFHIIDTLADEQNADLRYDCLCRINHN